MIYFYFNVLYAQVEIGGVSEGIPPETPHLDTPRQVLRLGPRAFRDAEVGVDEADSSTSTTRVP